MVILLKHAIFSPEAITFRNITIENVNFETDTDGFRYVSVRSFYTITEICASKYTDITYLNMKMFNLPIQ